MGERAENRFPQPHRLYIRFSLRQRQRPEWVYRCRQHLADRTPSSNHQPAGYPQRLPGRSPHPQPYASTFHRLLYLPVEHRGHLRHPVPDPQQQPNRPPDGHRRQQVLPTKKCSAQPPRRTCRKPAYLRLYLLQHQSRTQRQCLRRNTRLYVHLEHRGGRIFPDPHLRKQPNRRRHRHRC